MNLLAERKVKTADLRELMLRIWPRMVDHPDGEWKASPKQREWVRSFVARFECNDNDAFPSQRGTALNALNAMTGTVDHFIGQERAATLDDGMSAQAQQKRGVYTLLGQGSNAKSKALDTLLAMVEHGPRSEHASKVSSILSMTTGEAK
jgi:hypothetical protein